MNKQKLITCLQTSKKFVTDHATDTTSETVEEIQSLLSSAIASAQDDDADAVEGVLDDLEKNPVAGWNLTSDAREALVEAGE